MRKTTKVGFRPGLIQTELYTHRRWLEILDLQSSERNCIIRVAKTKALISYAETTKLICAFVFAHAKYWFSHDVAHISYNYVSKNQF